MDWLETDYYPLSGDVTLDDQQPHYLRVNSDQRDVRYNGRIGWLPREGDQYIFTYTKQKAENDIPTYSGSNANTDTRWWSSPGSQTMMRYGLARWLQERKTGIPLTMQ